MEPQLPSFGRQLDKRTAIAITERGLQCTFKKAVAATGTEDREDAIGRHRRLSKAVTITISSREY